MEALDRILDCEVTNETLDHMADTLEDYKNYLKSLNELGYKIKRLFLEQIKRDELLNNQEMDDDRFLLELSLNLTLEKSDKTSLDIITRGILNNEPLDLDGFIKLHRILINGTVDDKKENYEIRDHDVRVSSYINRQEHVLYYPPHAEEIQKYLDKLLAFINRCSDKEKQEFAILYKPIIEHFYITALQPFCNGNTRMSRLIQHGELFKLSRKLLDSNLDLPALYMSKNYFMSGPIYRENVARLIQTPNQEEIDHWFNYNLNLMDEQLYFVSDKVNKVLIRR